MDTLPEVHFNGLIFRASLEKQALKVTLFWESDSQDYFWARQHCYLQRAIIIVRKRNGSDYFTERTAQFALTHYSLEAPLAEALIETLVYRTYLLGCTTG